MWTVEARAREAEVRAAGPPEGRGGGRAAQQTRIVAELGRYSAVA